MNRWVVAAVVIVSIAFAVGRFFIPTHGLSPAGSYEAFAHLFVGGMIGAWLMDRKQRLLLWLAIAISVVELAAFLLLR